MSTIAKEALASLPIIGSLMIATTCTSTYPKPVRVDGSKLRTSMLVYEVIAM